MYNKLILNTKLENMYIYIYIYTYIFLYINYILYFGITNSKNIIAPRLRPPPPQSLSPRPVWVWVADERTLECTRILRIPKAWTFGHSLGCRCRLELSRVSLDWDTYQSHYSEITQYVEIISISQYCEKIEHLNNLIIIQICSVSGL